MSSQLEKIQSCRKVIITGGVAVGKSTTLENICELLNKSQVKWVKVPEYIDYLEDGVEMLTKYLKREISAFSFQRYVIQYYDDFLMKLQVDGDEILIFERTVDDAIACFAKINVVDGYISQQEYRELYRLATEINHKYQIPSFFSTNNEVPKFVFSHLLTSSKTQIPQNIFKIIMEKKDENIVVGLFNTDNECLRRVKERARSGEDSYTLQSIHNFNKYYNIVFNALSKSSGLSFSNYAQQVQ